MMNRLPASLFRIFLFLLISALSVSARAAWELDGERSTVQFMSVKNASVAELHHFKALSGAISASNEARVRIDLNSVETLVPIRNQRMRELFFETVRFPAATLSAIVPAELGGMAAGESRALALDVNVELHGASADYTAQVLVTRLADASLQVVLSEPLVVSAADFGLAAGVEMLREVAGLASISTAVPVSAQLIFQPAAD